MKKMKRFINIIALLMGVLLGCLVPYAVQYNLVLLYGCSCYSLGVLMGWIVAILDEVEE
jgi:hypothetical protein